MGNFFAVWGEVVLNNLEPKRLIVFYYVGVGGPDVHTNLTTKDYRQKKSKSVNHATISKTDAIVFNTIIPSLLVLKMQVKTGRLRAQLELN